MDFFYFYNFIYQGSIDVLCKPITLNGSGEEVDFVVFAIFSYSSDFGFSTRPSFIILTPLSLSMLHVKFKNNWCSGFREVV